MDFENILEIIYFELLLESLGILLGIGLLWQLFFQKGVSTLLSLFISSIC